MSEKMYNTRELSKKELEDFNKDLTEYLAGKSIRLSPQVFIKEGKIEASLLAVKLVELVESKKA